MEAKAQGRPVHHQGWTLALASVGLFMTSLDTLVVTNTLPVLRTSFGAGLGDLEWTLNAYNLAFACLLLTGAALGDRFGRKRMFGIGLSFFTAASAAAALSPTIGVLIAARAVQGAGAAIVMPMTLTLISEAFPAHKRGTAIGLWGGVAGLAVAAGPVVGGAITEGINWHWIFWLNLPVGAVLIPLGASRLTESHGPRPQLDIPGLAIAGAGLFAVTWALVKASSIGWKSPEVTTALPAGVALLAAFLAWERRAATPMLARALFRGRGFNAANGASFFMYVTLFGTGFLATQFLQTGLGYSPLAAGLRILPWTGAPLVISPIAGALADRYGNRPFMAAALALQGIGLGWVAAIAKPGMGYGELAAALALAGVGISLCFPTVANAAMGSVPPAEMGIASGTNSSIREIGGVFGIALLSTIFARPGVYTSPHVFIAGFAAAVRVGAAFSAAGIFAALLSPGRRDSQQAAAPAASGQAITAVSEPPAAGNPPAGEHVPAHPGSRQ